MIDKKTITECEEFAKEYYSKYEKDPNIWEEHIQLVRKYALQLAKIERVNEEILEMAAILHDIGKYLDRKDHAISSYELAKPFIEQINISNDKKELILKCILNHSTKSVDENNCIEIKIIQSADVLGTLFDDKWQEFSRKELSKKKLLKLYEKAEKKIQLESAKKIAQPQIKKLVEVLK